MRLDEQYFSVLRDILFSFQLARKADDIDKISILSNVLRKVIG